MNYILILSLLGLSAVQCFQNPFVVSVRPLRSTSKMLFGNPSDNKPSPKKDQGGGLFGGMGNMMESMKKAQEMAKQAEVLRGELQETKVTGSDSNGYVQCTFTGLAVPINIKISESAMSLTAEQLSEAATKAVEDGHLKAQGAMVAKMQSMYDMSLPANK